jgi:hypothetical protein
MNDMANMNDMAKMMRRPICLTTMGRRTMGRARISGPACR